MSVDPVEDYFRLIEEKTRLVANGAIAFSILIGLFAIGLILWGIK